MKPLTPQAALPHAGVEVAVLAELIRERRQLGRPQHVEPVGVVLLGLVPHVEHGEAVDVEPRLRFRLPPRLARPRVRWRGGAGAGPGSGSASAQPRGRGSGPRLAITASSQRTTAIAAGRPSCLSHDLLLVILRVRLLPLPHAAAGLVEEALVVALAHLLARLRRQPARRAARTCRRPSGTSPARWARPRPCRTGSGPGAG